MFYVPNTISLFYDRIENALFKPEGGQRDAGGGDGEVLLCQCGW